MANQLRGRIPSDGTALDTADVRRVEVVFGYADDPETLLNVTLRPLGWNAAQQWTNAVRNAVLAFLPMIAQVDQAQDLDLTTADGQALVTRMAGLLLDQAPQQIFDLLGKHRAFAPHIAHIGEYGTRAQVLTAFWEALQLEFPLGELRARIGPSLAGISKSFVSHTGASARTMNGSTPL